MCHDEHKSRSSTIAKLVEKKKRNPEGSINGSETWGKSCR